MSGKTRSNSVDTHADTNGRGNSIFGGLYNAAGKVANAAGNLIFRSKDTGDSVWNFKLPNGDIFNLQKNAEFSESPSERIIYKMCTIKMLLHECYFMLEIKGSLDCEYKTHHNFTDVYITEVFTPVVSLIFSLIPDFRMNQSHLSIQPNNLQEFNTQMGELIQDLQYFIMPGKFISEILRRIEQIEENIFIIYDEVLRTCAQQFAPMNYGKEKTNGHKELKDILYSSKKLLYYFSQLYLTIKEKPDCDVKGTFEKYVLFLKTIDTGVPQTDIHTFDEFVEFNVYHFNVTYNTIDTHDHFEHQFLHDFWEAYTVLSASGMKLLNCLEKATQFVYESKQDDEEEAEDEDEGDYEIKVQNFKEKLKELSKEIYKNYYVLDKELSRMHDEESATMRETLHRVITIDREFNEDFDEMIDAIRRICIDENKGLDTEFYKLREKFFYLQLGVYRDAIPEPPIPRGPGAPGDPTHLPNIVDIIRLFNRKADLLNQMSQHFHTAKYTKTPQHNRSDDESDLGEEGTSTRIHTGMKSTTEVKNRKTKSKGSSYTIQHEKVIVDENDWDLGALGEHMDQIRLNSLQFNSLDDFDTFVKSAKSTDNLMDFGGVIEQYLTNIQELDYTSNDEGVCKAIAEILFRNISGIFDRTSWIFSNDYVLKLCSLFINPTLSKQFEKLNELLFVKFTDEDALLCSQLRMDIEKYINNDTTICKKNTNIHGQCVFLFRYVSTLYEAFWHIGSLDNISRFFCKHKHLLFFLIVLLKKMTYKIANLHVFSRDSNMQYKIDEIFLHIIQSNPIEIYVKIRQNTKVANPRFDITHKLNESTQLTNITLRYYNYPGPLGFFQIHANAARFQDRDLKNTEQPKDPDTLLLYSYETALAQLGLDKQNKQPDAPKLDYHIEKYRLGNINGYIGHKDPSGEERFMNAIVTKLQEKAEDIIILGYGQSGAGKTSALIYYAQISKPGLIIKAVNKLRMFTICRLYVQELYFNWDKSVTSYQEISEKHYCIKSLTNKKYIEFVKNGPEWTFNDKGTNVALEFYLFNILKQRLYKPTENNPESSRTHILILMKFYIDENYHENTARHIVVGDLAGVENEFSCNINSLIEMKKIYEEEVKKGNYEKPYFEQFAENYECTANSTPSYNSIHFKRSVLISECFYMIRKFESISNKSKTLDFHDYVFKEDTAEQQNLYSDILERQEQLHEKVDLPDHDEFIKTFIHTHSEHYFTSVFFQLYMINNDDDNITTKMLNIINEIQNVFHLFTLKDHLESSFFQQNPVNGREITKYIVLFEQTFKNDSSNTGSLFAAAAGQNQSSFWVNILCAYLQHPARIKYIQKIKDLDMGEKDKSGTDKRLNYVHDPVEVLGAPYAEAIKKPSKVIEKPDKVQYMFIYSKESFEISLRSVLFSETMVKQFVRENSGAKATELLQKTTINILSIALEKGRIRLLNYDDNNKEYDISNYTAKMFEDVVLHTAQKYMYMSIRDLYKDIYVIIESKDFERENPTLHAFFIENKQDIFKTAEYVTENYMKRRYDQMDDIRYSLFKIFQLYRPIGILLPQKDVETYSNELDLNSNTVQLINSNSETRITTVLDSFQQLNSQLEKARSAYIQTQLTLEERVTTRFLTFARNYPYLIKKVFQIENNDLFDSTPQQVKVNCMGHSIQIHNRLIPLMYYEWEHFLPNILNGLKTTICDFIYYQIMKYICELRRQEGYFINKSLIDLKGSLSNYIIQNVMNKHYGRDSNVHLPYYFLGTSDEHCYDNNLSFNLFSFFNDMKHRNYTDDTRGIILDMIFKSKRNDSFNLDPFNTKLIFFTVVNLNDLDKGHSIDRFPLPTEPEENIKNGTRRITNNPPLPPYINTNVIKKFLNYKMYMLNILNFIHKNKIDEQNEMSVMYEHVMEHLHKTFISIREDFINHISISEYYNKNTQFMEKINDPAFLNIQDLEGSNDITLDILNVIERNNETTLIGTINFSNFAEVKNPNSVYPICDNVMNYVDIEKFDLVYPIDQFQFDKNKIVIDYGEEKKN